MLKKIAARELRVGMFVQQLGRSWLDHPFAVNRFLIKDVQDIQKISNSGIREVTIDTSKGLDILQKPTKSAAGLTPSEATTDVSQVSMAEEQGRAKVLFQEATNIHNCSDCFRLEQNCRVGLSPTGKTPP